MADRGRQIHPHDQRGNVGQGQNEPQEAGFEEIDFEGVLVRLHQNQRPEIAQALRQTLESLQEERQARPNAQNQPQNQPQNPQGRAAANPDQQIHQPQR